MPWPPRSDKAAAVFVKARSGGGCVRYDVHERGGLALSHDRTWCLARKSAHSIGTAAQPPCSCVFPVRFPKQKTRSGASFMNRRG